jgi:hypothetical protein
MGLTARVLLAVVFAAAACGKARNRAALARFAGGLADFRWIPVRLRRLTAAAVVAAEVAAVPLLFLAPRAGAVLSVGMLAAFTVATVAAGRQASCQCFGPGRTTGGGGGGAAFVSRNVVLMAAGLLVGLVPCGAADSTVWVTAAGTGAICGAMIAAWDELGYLLGRSARLG